jgi:histidine ammonia-lyase
MLKVSMGTIAARKCREIVKNAEYVIAIELMCAAQAMDLFTT